MTLWDIETQIENRHLADYDPIEHFAKAEAQLAIATAEAAIEKV